MKIRWFVYILKCSDESFYTGITKNLEARVIRHNSGKAAKYTKSRLPVRLIYFEEVENYRIAFYRELKIKKLSHQKKLSLIKDETEGILQHYF